MKGLELSRGFFEEYGMPMLRSRFPEILPLMAAGLIGSGSECAGFDDAVSEDHDFEPGFCVFIPGEDIVDRRTAFLLERAYAGLPKEYKGYKRPLIQPAGGSRRGVIVLPDFLKQKTGHADVNLSPSDWFRIPEQILFELTGGEVYFDNYGELSRVRRELSYYPEDIRLKKLSGELFRMAQSGQYNYLRCYDHGETEAAQLAVFEFVKSTLSVIFLLNKKYQPFYKWVFRALRGLSFGKEMADELASLMTSPNEAGNVLEKADLMEKIAGRIIAELVSQGVTRAAGSELETHAYSVNDSIADTLIRNM